MNTLKKALNFLFLFGYAHEVWHYLAARAFGLRATIHTTRVEHDQPREVWHWVVITLAPFGVFAAIFGLTAWLWVRSAKTPADHRIWAGWLLISLGWIGTCWTDLREIWTYYRSGNWHEGEE